MANKVEIGVSANLDTSGVEQKVNALGQKVAQANGVKFNPVSVKSIEDVAKLTKQFEQLLKIHGELRKRVKDTGQAGKGLWDMDLEAMFPDKNALAKQSRKITEYVLGPGAFSQMAPPPPPGAGGAGGKPPPPPGAPPPPPPPPSGGGGGAGGIVTPIVQAGLRAAGPAGGVAAKALGAGMSGGIGAGLMGLAGGMAALGISKIISGIMERVDQAEDNAVALDRLKRTLGDVNVSFAALKAVVNGSGDNLKVTYAEAGQLATQFVKLGNVTSEQYKTLSDELGVGVGMSRSFGLDTSQGVGVMGQMRGVGMTTNTQESRRLAVLIGETIGKSGAFAKADEVMDAMASFATSQTRASLGQANGEGYAGMFASMASSGIPGLDPAGVAGILARVNATLSAGGGKGEASQYFTGKLGAARGMDVFDTQLWREGGAFGTADNVFNGNGAVSRFYDKYDLDKPMGDQTLLSANLEQLKKEYASNPKMMLQATANQTGLSMSQAAPLLLLDPKQMGELERLVGGDLSKMSGSSLGNLSKVVGSAADRQALAKDYLGRVGPNKLTDVDRASITGARDDDELKRVLADIASRYDQERTTGSDIRDSKALLDNIKTSIADKLVPMTQAMRDGILFMAGGGKKSRLDVMKDIEGVESQGRVQGIDTKFQEDLKGNFQARGQITAEMGALVQKNLPKVASGEMTQAEHVRQMMLLQQREAEIIRRDAEIRQQHTDALEEETKLLKRNIKRLEDDNVAQSTITATNASLTAGDVARMDRQGLATAGGGPGSVPGGVPGDPGGGRGTTYSGPGGGYGSGYAGGAGAGRGGGNKASKGDTDAAMKFFMDKGWTEEQAAGIVANGVMESGLNANPKGYNDGGSAYGAFQWHGDRQANFKKWAGHDIRDSTLEEQYGFVDYELRHGEEQAAGRRLMRATSKAQAGAIVSQYYERPKRVAYEAGARGSIAETISAPKPEVPAAALSRGEDDRETRARGGAMTVESTVKLDLSADAKRALQAQPPAINTTPPTNWSRPHR